jgi:16S rRNA (guanine527-N7)-methyltransferase
VGQDGRAQQSALDHLAHTVRVLSGGPIGASARGQFSRYLDLLLLWNRAQNLTGFESPAEIVRGLFEDSLLFLPLLPDRPLRVVDIGAGAGIPGMPLRIIDEGIEVTLIESKRKRVSFLKTLRRELGLEKSVVIEEGRAEVLVSELVRRDGEFDVAVARAVGDLKQVLPTALQYLKPRGVFIISAPPPARLVGLGAE